MKIEKRIPISTPDKPSLWDLSVAQQNGRDACNEDQPFLSNPYDRSSMLWLEWRVGYLCQLEDNNNLTNGKRIVR